MLMRPSAEIGRSRWSASAIVLAMTQAPLTIIQGKWCINPKTDLEQKLPTPRLIKEEIMTPMSELTDTELDAVCGGIAFNIGNPVVQTNLGINVVGFAWGKNLNQTNNQTNWNNVRFQPHAPMIL
jgi:hypothetical protein